MYFTTIYFKDLQDIDSIKHYDFKRNGSRLLSKKSRNSKAIVDNAVCFGLTSMSVCGITGLNGLIIRPRLSYSLASI